MSNFIALSIALLICLWKSGLAKADLQHFSKKEILKYREDVKTMFYHAYDGYMTYAYPYDELRPLTCDGHDTWGSYSLTLIDALDTLAVMDNKTEFQKVVKLIIERSNFEADINVSVFETNIRIVGGLLSGHLLSHRMGVEITKEWPCDGPLLKLAVDAATRLLPAFDTPTGMPYGTVNLKYGVPEGETPVTCAAGVGTFVLEFGTLSRLTGNYIFENIALRAMHALWERRSRLDLIGNHIDVLTGLWTGHDSGIGAGVDSFFEYLVKGSFLLQRPELMAIFKIAREAIERHLRHDDWYFWKSMQRGQITMTVFQSLEAFWPGVLTLVGDIENAQKTLFNYHQVVKQYGFTPEFYNVPQANAYSKRGGFPLRPEFIESLMYLYQATKDHTFLKMGADFITSINHSAKTECGYATIENVVDHTLANRMESFFLAETTKYLYLLFHEDHWLHSFGDIGVPHVVGKRVCVIDSGGFFYNTEAHPIDSGSLACCSGPEDNNLLFPEEDLVNIILDPTRVPNKNFGKPVKRHIKKKLNGIVKGIKVENESNVEESANKLKNNEKGAIDDQISVEYEKNEETLGCKNDKITDEHKINHENLEIFLKKLNEMYENVEANMEAKKHHHYIPITGIETSSIPSVANDDSPNTITDINDVITSTTVKMEIDKTSVDSKESTPIESITVVNSTDKSNEELESPVDNIETIYMENDTRYQYEGDDIVNIKDELDKRKESDKEKLPWDPRFSSLSVDNGKVATSSQEPLAEMSGIATSVSSSKFTLSGASSENLIIQKEEQLTYTPPKKVFSIADLNTKLTLDMAVRKNLSAQVSYALLSCPVSSFVQSLSYKGQMVNVEP